MTHHVVIHLPDDRVACADYREPIVTVMRKINAALADFRSPDPAHFATVAAWLDQHREQSALCQDSLSPGRLGCGHGAARKAGQP